MTRCVAEDMSRAVDALTRGFSEPIEYVVEVNGVREARRSIRKYAALIDQLSENITTPLQSRGSDCGGGGKPGSRPPLNMAYSNCLDTLHEQARGCWVLMHDWEADDKWTLPVLLRQLHHSVVNSEDDDPYAATVARTAQRWVRDARILLGYESRKVTLTDTICGECGGTLVVAFDATSDVKCIGTYDSDPCGMVYGRLQWISLLK